MDFTYKGLKGQYTRHIVTDAEVERSLQRLRQTARVTTVDNRPTELGDEIVLDYAGYCDGEQFAGGTAENQTLVLGSGTFIPGFEEQLVDKVVGEQVTVKVTFPKEYHAENLAGKEAEFICTVQQIRIRSAYELDDTFAKEVGGCDTMDQMREKLRQSLQAHADEQAEMDLQDGLLRQAAETLEFAPNQAQIDAETENQIQNLSAQLAQQGLNLEMYCQFMSTDVDTLRADMRANAENAVKMRAAIELIADLEQLEASKEEIGEAVAIIARQNGMTVEQLKPFYDAEFEHAVIQSVLAGKAMRLVRENATVTVTEE